MVAAMYKSSANVRNHYVLLPQTELNSYPHELNRCQALRPYQHGDFVLHFPGNEKASSLALYINAVPTTRAPTPAMSSDAGHGSPLLQLGHSTAGGWQGKGAATADHPYSKGDGSSIHLLLLPTSPALAQLCDLTPAAAGLSMPCFTHYIHNHSLLDDCSAEVPRIGATKRFVRYGEPNNKAMGCDPAREQLTSVVFFDVLACGGRDAIANLAWPLADPQP